MVGEVESSPFYFFKKLRLKRKVYMSEKKVIVIGIGNPNFKDDGVGLKVVEELEKLGIKDTVKYLNIDLKIIDSMRGYKKAIIVDAVKIGVEPGTILEFNGRETWSKVYASGTHSMSIFEVIRIGYEVFPEEMPEEVKIIGIEGEEVLSLGMELTPSVQKAVPKVVEKILKKINE
jgi:hydrogenase maturation protease